MTGFGSLYYTDCVPGQGLQGGAGFQFQAATPGPATEAMHVVQRSALYEPPAAWMRDRRPVADYPRSLAHLADEGFLATAAGRYLGQEANGTRQGNQFTHTIVTRDPADYGSVRPAQLWGAPWWAHEPALGTTLAELPPIESTPGPLEIEVVRDRVAGAPGADGLLTALVSALEHLTDPARRRTVVLVGADPERAACWLAAATLLLPARQALRISFKIFVSDPQYARHEVVALHPGWAGRWADTAADSGLAVFDLDRGRCSEVESTPSAAFWVPRFLHGDPYDIVDAVELAGLFADERVTELRSAPPPTSADDVATPAREADAADRLVAVVDRAGEQLRHPGDLELVARWLQTAPEKAVKIAREPALEALLATVPPAGVLRTMAEAVSDRGWDDAAVHRVLDGLLTSELVEVTRAEGRPALRAVLGYRRLRVPTRPDGGRGAVRVQVESALCDAPPDQVPALLLLARRHGVPIEPSHEKQGRFADAIDRFAAWWLENADDELMPRSWDAPVEALDWVRDVLRGWLAAGGEHFEYAKSLVWHRWWVPLRPAATDPRDELDKLVLSSAYPRLDEDEVRSFRRNLIATCADLLPETDGGEIWSILYRFVQPQLHECRQFVDELEPRRIPMSQAVAQELAQRVDKQRGLTRDGLFLLHAIHGQGYGLPRNLVEQREHDLAVLDVIAALPKQERAAEKLGTALVKVPAEHRRVRVPDLVDGLLAVPPDRAAAVLRATDHDVLMELCRAIEARWPRPGKPVEPGAGAAALAFVLTAKFRDPHQKKDLEVLRTKLGNHVMSLSKEGEERAAIFRALPPRWQEQWGRWMRDVEPSLFRRLGKATSGLRGEPGKKEG